MSLTEKEVREKIIKRRENWLFWIIVALFLAVALCYMLCGCASQAKQAPTPKADSVHYVVQAEPQVPMQIQAAQLTSAICPKCGYCNEFKQPPELYSAIKCGQCGGSFPYLGTTAPQQQPQSESHTQDKPPYQGPAVLRRGYFYNVKYLRNNRHDSDVNWNIGHDGSSGSISSTNSRINEYYRVGDRGTYSGPADFVRNYGGY
ncbi:MAG: hypothetical protein L6Q29_01575 [Candidatus Pacebacteria bacterium]|nr:hypothetical protein [Candidatus Paceibacterota bacterium]NUQ57556.1 hypothetical protein [Candidatus Paceibacter sp.]